MPEAIYIVDEAGCITAAVKRKSQTMSGVMGWDGAACRVIYEKAFPGIKATIGMFYDDAFLSKPVGPNARVPWLNGSIALIGEVSYIDAAGELEEQAVDTRKMLSEAAVVALLELVSVPGACLFDRTKDIPIDVDYLLAVTGARSSS